MGRIFGPDMSASFVAKFRKGDRVVVTAAPPLAWLRQPRGVVWDTVPRRRGYLVRYASGQLGSWQEDELRPAFGHYLRRSWQVVRIWWQQLMQR